tara:strand:- start:17 stop:610 length:594 start_codon:yes stop_codon:yes gene_type:complete
MMKNYLFAIKNGGLFTVAAVASIATIGISPPSQAGTVNIPNGPLTVNPTSNSPNATLDYNLTTVVNTCQLSQPVDGQLALFQNGNNQWIASTDSVGGLNLTSDIPQFASITATSNNSKFRVRASAATLISNGGAGADLKQTKIVGESWGNTSTRNFNRGQKKVDVDVRFRRNGQQTFTNKKTYRAEVTVTCLARPSN